MPKNEYLKRIDAQQRNATVSQPSTARSYASGNADTVDFHHASIIPRPWTLLTLDENAKFPASVLPASGFSGEQATGHHGVQYIGPTTYLVKKCLETDEYIFVSAPVLSTGDRIVVSDYRTPSEHMYVLGGPDNIGGTWRYVVSRSKNDPRTQTLTTAQTHEKWAQVISLGPAGSGHIYIVSAADDSEPYIQVRDNNTDSDADTPYSTTWKVQMGSLSNVPQWFKDLFPETTDWSNKWGFAGEDVFVSGGIHAKHGTISGSLNVTGLLTVKEKETGARLEFGNTVSGWGTVMRNSTGEPVWMIVSPYEDETGNFSAAAWVVQSHGKRGIYHRYDQASEQWLLTIANWTISENEIVSQNESIILNSEDEFISIGNVKMINDNGDLLLFGGGDFRVAGTAIATAVIAGSGGITADGNSEFKGALIVKELSTWDASQVLQFGQTTTFTSSDGKTLTVTNGIITKVV